MATCEVYQNAPGDGSGQMSAQQALHAMNIEEQSWHIVMNHNAHRTVHAATPQAGVTVIGDALEALLKPQFSTGGYRFASAH